MSQFNGQVPEDINSLLKITGVGKGAYRSISLFCHLLMTDLGAPVTVFADLLAFVNTRKSHNDAEYDECRIEHNGRHWATYESLTQLHGFVVAFFVSFVSAGSLGGAGGAP